MIQYKDYVARTQSERIMLDILFALETLTENTKPVQKKPKSASRKTTKEKGDA